MTRLLPPFPALRAFEAAARHESLSAAGDELHVTHGAISRQVAALEAWLGKPVFHRHGRRVRLTDDGRRYLAEISAAFDRIAVATDEMRDRAPGQVLRINALPTLAMKWLLPRLSRFQRDMPSVELKLSTSNAPLDTLEGQYDVAIRTGPARWPNRVSARFLDESLVPVCSPELVRRGPIAHAGDLAQHVLLHAETRPQAWRDWFEAAGTPLPGHQKQSFDHFYLALQAASDGLGVALGPLPLIDDELASGRLVVPLDGPRIAQRQYWWIAAREGSPLVVRFCAWLDAQAHAQDSAQTTGPGSFSLRSSA